MAAPDLGLRIRRARERLRMTQAQLAFKLDVGVRTVGGWERGESVPRNSIGALEDVLAVSLSDGDVPLDPNEEAILAMDKLAPADRGELLAKYRELTGRDGGHNRRTGLGAAASR